MGRGGGLGPAYLRHCLSPVSELAAWLAEKGPISVAINAFGMQVRSQACRPWLSLADSFPTSPWNWPPTPYSRPPPAPPVLPPRDLPPTEAPLQPLAHRPCRAARGLWQP